MAINLRDFILMYILSRPPFFKGAEPESKFEKPRSGKT